MRSLTCLLVFLSIFSAVTLKPNAKTITKPNLFHFPITKGSDYLFSTTLNVGSAGKSPVRLVLDLGTNVTWLNCRKLKSLSSLRLATCKSSTCKSIPGTTCKGNSCLCQQFNPYAIDPVSGRVVQDRISFHAADLQGGNILPPVSVRRFTFVCASQKNLVEMSNDPADGVLGLSPVDTSFTKQVTSALGVIPKFYLCLPSSTSGSGHLFVGGGLSFPRTLTPLTGTASGGYSVTVKSIYVDGVPLSLKPDLLKGGAKLITGFPYTSLHTDIYNAIAKSFTQRAKAMGISKVRAIAPFKDCFDARTIGRNSMGPNVPVIEIGMPGRAGEVKLRFYGANVVVKHSETVMCLAFLDGSERQEEMYIGTHQIQDYMLEFDLSTSLLGFSDSLLLQNTSCSTWVSQK